jgi:hypothetical protein
MTAQFVGALLGVAHTTPQAAVGTIHVDKPSNNTYMYLQADGAVDANKPYSYDNATGQIEDIADAAVVPADTESTPICVPGFAMADNEYGWIMVGPGSFTCTTDATGVVAANDTIHISATVGTLSSGVTAALLVGVNATAIIAGAASGTFYATNRMWAQDLT